MGEQGPVGEAEPAADSDLKIDSLAIPVGEDAPPADQRIDSLALLAEANASEEVAPESNASAEVAEVTFDDVREEVRQRIIEGDRIDAERDASDLAKGAASKFLLQLHQLSDDLKKKYALLL